jgi:L-fucose mutarotase
MLIGIDPALSGDLLKILDDMGHGDQLVIADRNYPIYAAGKPVIRMGDVGVIRALNAILSVFPLDTYVPYPLERMEVENNPDLIAPIQMQVLDYVRENHLPDVHCGIIPRLEFYERAKSAFAVIHTLEDQPYGCFILTKGVVFDPDKLPPTSADI